MIKLINEQHPSREIGVGEITASHLSDLTSYYLYHASLPSVAGFIEFNLSGELELDFRVKLHPMAYTKLSGYGYALQETSFKIMDTRFIFSPETSRVPRVEENLSWHRNIAAIDKIFFEWLGEVKHHHTLAKIAI